MTEHAENKGQGDELRGNPGKHRARGEILDEFKAYLQALKRDPDTIRDYSLGVRRFFEFLDRQGVEDLRAVTREHVRIYQAELTQTDLTPHTVHARLRAVRRLYEYLEANNKVLMNPAMGVQMPKLTDRIPRTILTKSEMKRLLDAPDTSSFAGIRDKAMLEVFYSTGLRLGELCALTIYDIDVLNGYVRVNSGKGCKDRVVPIGHKARKYVREYMHKVRGRFTKKNRDERSLFVGSRCGRPIHPKYVTDLIHLYADSAGIRKNVTPHVFRHTCATHMLADGADVVHIQRLLGHVLLCTTQIYTRVAGREVKQTHNRTHPREKDKE